MADVGRTGVRVYVPRYRVAPAALAAAGAGPLVGDPLDAAAALGLAARLAEGPPVALGMATRAIYQAAEEGLEDVAELEVAFEAISSATADAREGVRPFAERRPPRFEGG